MIECICRCQMVSVGSNIPPPQYMCEKGEENESYLYLNLTPCVSFLYLGVLMGKNSTVHLGLPLSGFVNSFGLLCWLVLWFLWLPAPADSLS